MYSLGSTVVVRGISLPMIVHDINVRNIDGKDVIMYDLIDTNQSWYSNNAESDHGDGNVAEETFVNHKWHLTVPVHPKNGGQ